MLFRAYFMIGGKQAHDVLVVAESEDEAKKFADSYAEYFSVVYPDMYLGNIEPIDHIYAFDAKEMGKTHVVHLVHDKERLMELYNELR